MLLAGRNNMFFSKMQCCMIIKRTKNNQREKSHIINHQTPYANTFGLCLKNSRTSMRLIIASGCDILLCVLMYLSNKCRFPIHFLLSQLHPRYPYFIEFILNNKKKIENI